MVLLSPLFPYSWSFPSWDLRRVLNCILIALIEFEDSSNVEVDEGFISLASLFGISAYLSFGCVLSCFNHVRLYATQWIVACQASLSMGFSRQEYWSELPLPSPVDLSNPGIKPRSPVLQADSLPESHKGNPRTLEWVAYPFYRGSSQPKNWTRVSCTAGAFFANWGIRETLLTYKQKTMQYWKLKNM